MPHAVALTPDGEFATAGDVTPDSLFWLASMTKPITTLGALRRLAQGTTAAEIDALLAKEQATGLDAAERDRLRQLLSESRHPAR